MDIGLQLQQTPNWSSLNAYERAKLCCQLLNTLGLPIPSWMQIRQWIGKGSANDIHRAKQDFLLDRQTVKTEWITQNDLPTALSGSLQDWWQQLKHAAEQEYLAEKQQWQQAKIEQATQLAAATQQIEQTQQQLVQLQAKIDEQNTAYQHACEQLLIKEHVLTTQQRQIEQLSELLTSQQQLYLAAQASQRTEQMENQQNLEERMTQRLDAQLSAVADFQVFAIQQIDQARQQITQLENQQQRRQQSELLDALQQITTQQTQQQNWLRHYLLKQQLAQNHPNKKRGHMHQMRGVFRV